MYTAYIGRRLLDLYNEHCRDGPPLDPRSFFDEVFFPLFFDDEKYLMLANNSKFDQAAKQKKKRPLTKAVRREALDAYHTDAATLTEPHGHLLLGGTARGVEAATSSQITDIPIPVSPDEVYLSWFGTAASIGVKGGLSLLVDADEVLLALLEGWRQYRVYMQQTSVLKPYQIDSWNGWWLIHRFDEDFASSDPLRDFPLHSPDEPVLKNGVAAFSTPPWARVLFALAGLEGARQQTAYVYSFGQTNTTVGFVQLDLPKVRSVSRLYERLFGRRPEFVGRRQFERLYETAFGFRRACEMGRIGVRAIEPNKLRDFMPVRGSKNKLPKAPSGKTQAEQEVTFATYQTWIIAMLNNEQLLAFADEAAEALHEYAGAGKRGKTINPRAVTEGVLGASHRRAFIEGLTEILNKDGTHAAAFNRLVEEVVKMPTSDFPLLLTLIKFKYALRNHRAAA